MGSGQHPDMDEQLERLKDDATIERFGASRRRLHAQDPLLPAYHFSPPEGWLNDPNGLCFWHGKYHLFYQFRPEGESRVQWGHTVSDDLIHWSDLPPAISPSIEDCCFSGTTCVEGDRVVALYYGTKQGSMVATSKDPLLLNWEKHPDNPVIPAVDADETGYREGGGDPCIWKEEGVGYFALVGGRGRESVDQPFHLTARLFFSQDLSRWIYLGRFLDDEIHTVPHDDGSCPYFCPIGDKYLYCYFSHKSSSGYFIGDYDRTLRRFTPLTHGRFTGGEVLRGSIHAPSILPTSDGGCYAIFNAKECRERDVGRIRSIMTLPRQFTLRADNTLGIQPAEAAKTLRHASRDIGTVSLPANEDVPLHEACGNTIEIETEIDPLAARMVCLNVLQSPAREEYTPVCFYIDAGGRTENLAKVLVDPSRSSLRDDVNARIPESMEVQLEEDRIINCRIFVDRSIIEVFVNGLQCVTLRVHPSRPDSTGISLRAQGGAARIKKMIVHQMRSIWK